MPPLERSELHRLLSEARAIAYGGSRKAPTRAHLRALIYIAGEMALALEERGEVIAALMSAPRSARTILH